MYRHRFLPSILVIVTIAAAACVPTPTTPTPAPTVAPTSAPTATATTPPVAPTATPTVTPTTPPTQAPAATDTATPDPTVATFTSQRLGISFDYRISVDGLAAKVGEVGDKVYIVLGDLPLDQGQYVQVYPKAPDDSLIGAIIKQILTGYSLQDCLATSVASPEQGLTWPASYAFARIDVPRTEDDDMETLWQKAERCPQPQAAFGGIAYFLMDTDHPDRFLFFSIGQYYIPARGDQPWQNTIRVLPSSSMLASPDVSAAVFTDDRSSGDRLMASYVNAINRQEYARAYSYWSEAGAASELQPFDQFAAGYRDTKSVELTIGAVTSDAGAGQLYYSVPVVMMARDTGDARQTFAGCYVMHLARPEFQMTPPFQPLAIERAAVTQVGESDDVVDLLASACRGEEGQPVGPPAYVDPTDISALRYVDNRSDAVSVIRSLMNAINSKQYARAYAYWQSEPGTPGGPPPYDQFRQGYAETESVALITGRVTSEGAAGSIYYKVPAVLLAQTSGGGHQTFYGCYTVRQGQPALQGQPPFEPMGIIAGSFRQDTGSADPQSLLQGACE